MKVFIKGNQMLRKIVSVCLLVSLMVACSDKPEKDAAIAQIEKFIGERNIDKTRAGWKRNLPMPPKLTFTKDKKYFWLLRTDVGNIKLELMADVAPMHVSSTIYLSTLEFYDNLNFHRVIPRFMAQGGDPMGNGSGGPGYKYSGEFSVDAKHDKRGVLSMANAGPNTDGSQFFITFKETPHLNGRHTVFGQVVEGMDTLDKLEKHVKKAGNKPVKIIKAMIIVE